MSDDLDSDSRWTAVSDGIHGVEKLRQRIMTANLPELREHPLTKWR